MECRKQKHVSEFRAGKQIVSLAKKLKIKRNRFRIYLCGCGFYHITTMTKEQYKKSINNARNRLHKQK